MRTLKRLATVAGAIAMSEGYGEFPFKNKDFAELGTLTWRVCRGGWTSQTIDVSSCNAYEQDLN